MMYTTSTYKFRLALIICMYIHMCVLSYIYTYHLYFIFYILYFIFIFYIYMSAGTHGAP